jgi:polyhydroxybutyrate depolymerase
MSYAVQVKTLVQAILLTVVAVSASSAEENRRVWTVDGTVRVALVFAPEKATSELTPVVFGFHGHGGSMNNAARSFRFHELWPEAIIVYMEGLKTPGQLTDPKGLRAGWQKEKGDQQDRDLKFFDAVLQSIRKDYKVDENRIYCSGHSNGGSFAYLLWAERGETFAALAPSGSAALKIRNQLKPKPVLHVAGQNDPLVRFQWQKTMIDRLKELNQCEAGIPWQGMATLFPSKSGNPVITFVTDQGHRYPAEAPPLIVKFFKEQVKP